MVSCPCNPWDIEVGRRVFKIILGYTVERQRDKDTQGHTETETERKGEEEEKEEEEKEEVERRTEY